MNYMIKNTLITTLLLVTMLAGSNTISTNAQSKNKTQNKGTDQLAAKYCTVPLTSSNELKKLAEFDITMVNTIAASQKRYNIDLANENSNIKLYTDKYNKNIARISAVQQEIKLIIDNYNKTNKVIITPNIYSGFNDFSDIKAISSKLQRPKVVYTGGYSTLSENANITKLETLTKVKNQQLESLINDSLINLFNAENVVYNNLDKKYQIYLQKSNRNTSLEKIKECKNRIEQLIPVAKPKPPTIRKTDKKNKRIVISRSRTNSRNLISRIGNSSRVIG